MGRAHGVRERDREGEETLEGEAAGWNGLVERIALDVLHGEKAQAVRLLDRVQHHDPRVAQRGDRAGFPLKSTELLRYRGHLRREDLERHAPAQAHPPRGTRRPSPAAKRLKDAVGAEGGTIRSLSGWPRLLTLVMAYGRDLGSGRDNA